jgi:hypothetical protein
LAPLLYFVNGIPDPFYSFIVLVPLVHIYQYKLQFVLLVYVSTVYETVLYVYLVLSLLHLEGCIMYAADLGSLSVTTC